jgi:hypothetical protein
VAGQTAHLEPAIDELRKGGALFTALTLDGLPGNFRLPGGIVWDGKYLAWGDPDHSLSAQTSSANPRCSGPNPAGGSPTKTIPNIPYLPIGTALSVAPKAR